MDKNILTALVAAIAIFISLLLAVFLITLKTKHKLSNRLFALFLILSAIDISGLFHDLVFQGPSNLSMLRNNAIFLQLPAFYLYVLSVCYSDFSLKSKHLIHTLPFIIVNLILIPNYYSVDTSQKLIFFENHKDLFELKFTHFFMHFQIGIYIVAILLILKRSKRLHLENFANSSIKSYQWLFQLTVALAIFYTIALVKNIYKFTDYENISEWIRSGLLIFELFIVCWYLFKALNHPDLFRNIDSKLKLVNDIIVEEKEQAISSAVDTDLEEELQDLQKFMVNEKPFLEPNLTIKDISDKIEIPVKELSILINHKLNQHFFDFINTYRIEAAMEILRDPSKDTHTVLEILYEVGFNSKSSFNTSFKKHAGVTPTVYRQKHLKKGF